jgi:quinol monooxygenase YgiN
MFARIMEIVPKMDKKDELIRVAKNEILPLVKKQAGFLEVLPFIPEVKTEKVIVIGLWTEKKYFEKYERDIFPRVEEILKPYLLAPVEFKLYNLETTVCEHFEKALAA